MIRIAEILLAAVGAVLWVGKYEKHAEKIFLSTWLVALAGSVLYVYVALKTREWNPFVGEGNPALLPWEFCVFAYVFAGIAWICDRLFSNGKLWQRTLRSRVMGMLVYLSWVVLLITIVDQFKTR